MPHAHSTAPSFLTHHRNPLPIDGGALEKLLAAAGVSAQHAGGDFAGGQCGDTRLGLKCTNLTGPGYLDFAGTFDLIHANWGLHDLADYGPTLPQLPLSVYGSNLETIYGRLAKRGKQIMWTATTPCPDVPTSYNRTYDSVIAYNKEALAALTRANGGTPPAVNDLWSDFIAHCGERYKSCDLQLPANVHLTQKGIDFAAASAAKAILAALGL